VNIFVRICLNVCGYAHDDRVHIRKRLNKIADGQTKLLK